MSDIQPAVTAEYARLRAECERLQEQLDAWKDKAFDALATLKQANDNTEAAEAECERLRAALRETEAMLSLLRYRGEIRNWGRLAMPDQRRVDQAISAARAALGEADDE